MPVVNPRFKREFFNGPAKNRRAALTRSDMLLTSEGKHILLITISIIDSKCEIVEQRLYNIYIYKYSLMIEDIFNKSF